MIGAFLLGFILGVIGLFALLVWLGGQQPPSIRRAAHEVDIESIRARRAMNDAAGQSWRSLVDDDRA